MVLEAMGEATTVTSPSSRFALEHAIVQENRKVGRGGFGEYETHQLALRNRTTQAVKVDPGPTLEEAAPAETAQLSVAATSEPTSSQNSRGDLRNSMSGTTLTSGPISKPAEPTGSYTGPAPQQSTAPAQTAAHDSHSDPVPPAALPPPAHGLNRFKEAGERFMHEQGGVALYVYQVKGGVNKAGFNLLCCLSDNNSVEVAMSSLEGSGLLAYPAVQIAEQHQVQSCFCGVGALDANNAAAAMADDTPYILALSTALRDTGLVAKPAVFAVEGRSSLLGLLLELAPAPPSRGGCMRLCG